MPSLLAHHSLADAFAICVRDAPHELALYDDQERLTFAQLDARAARVAAGLVARGLADGAHVGVVLARSVAAITCALGIFRAGGVVVPMDPEWPEARREAVVRDADLAFAIGESGGAVGGRERIPYAALGAPVTAPFRQLPARRDRVAVALYTSGSTGDPKAVLLPHRALLARVHALAIALPYEAGETACHRTPFTFVDALAEVFGPLLHRLPVYVLPCPFALDDLVRALGRERISRLLLVPSLLALLLDACPDLARCAPQLRLVVASGEPLTSSLARRLQAAAPNTRLVNVYGSTEVAGDATLGEVPSPPPPRIDVGRPLAGVVVHLVDDAGGLVGAGEIGEIAVAGDMLALGYWRRPELTRERFVQSALVPNGPLFRTGDRGRWLDDGSLELLGRLDDQVKIAGVRVELGEIKSALESHEAVREAAVATEENEGRLHVVAGVVLRNHPPRPTLTIDALLDHARARVPAAAVPHTVAFLETIPRTVHGKLDRTALVQAVHAAKDANAHAAGSVDVPVRAVPDAASLDRAAGKPPAQDALLARFAALFSTLTGGACVGADDDFARRGGDSLARLRLLVMLAGDGYSFAHDDLPLPLTPRALADAARRLTARVSAPAFFLDARDGQVLDRSAKNRDDAFPLTDFQRVMALESVANLGTSVWCDQVTLTIEGALSVAELEQAWRRVVAREPSLRTSVAWRDLSEPLQLVHTEVPVTVARVPLQHLDIVAYRQRVLAEEWERMSTSFVLEAAPLWTLCLLEGPAHRRDLVLTYHHVILDGESARRVLRAAFDEYAHRPEQENRSETFRSFVDRTRQSPLPAMQALFDLEAASPLPVVAAPSALGMGDLVWRAFHRAVDLRRRVARARLARRVRRDKALRALLDRERLVAKPYVGGDIVAQPVSRALARSIRAWATRGATTPIALWVALYSLHLARDSGRVDVLFGMVLAGRDGRSAGTVGMLANCLPLRLRIDRNETVLTYATRVTAALRDLTAHGQTPLLALARRAHLDPRAFLDTLFVTWAFDDQAWNPPEGLAIRDGRGVTSNATDLAVILSQVGETWDLGVAASAFHRADRVRIHLLAMLDALLDGEPTMPVSTLLDFAIRDGGMIVALAPL